MFREFEDEFSEFEIFRKVKTKNSIWGKDETFEKLKDVKGIIFMNKKLQTEDPKLSITKSSHIFYFPSEVRIKIWDKVIQDEKEYEVQFLEEKYDFNKKKDHNIAYLIFRE